MWGWLPAVPPVHSSLLPGAVTCTAGLLPSIVSIDAWGGEYIALRVDITTPTLDVRRLMPPLRPCGLVIDLRALLETWSGWAPFQPHGVTLVGRPVSDAYRGGSPGGFGTQGSLHAASQFFGFTFLTIAPLFFNRYLYTLRSCPLGLFSFTP